MKSVYYWKGISPKYSHSKELTGLPRWLRCWRTHLPMQETQVQSLSQEDPLEEKMATHSSILAWRIPWTEEPAGLQSIGSQRVEHNWSALACTLTTELTNSLLSSVSLGSDTTEHAHATCQIWSYWLWTPKPAVSSLELEPVPGSWTINSVRTQALNKYSTPYISEYYDTIGTLGSFFLNRKLGPIKALLVSIQAQCAPRGPGVRVEKAK